MSNKKPLAFYDVNTGYSIEIQSGDYIDPTTLGSGTASSSTFLRGDGTWAVPAGGSGGSALLTDLNVKNAPYNAKGDGSTDDSAAIQAALNATDANGKYYNVYVPAGTYMCHGLNLHSGQTLYGDDWDSVLSYNGDFTAATSKYLISTYQDAQPAGAPQTGYDPNTYNMKNVRVHDLKFLGNMGPTYATTWEEHNYIMNVNATTDMLIERCWFEGWMGDAIYIGSGNTAGYERHNYRIRVRDCMFDGKADGTANYCNRQGISIIDGTDIYIEDCRFQNIGRKSDTDMGTALGNPQEPGAIDIEPDVTMVAYVRIEGIYVRRCTFDNIWNAAKTLCINLPPQNNMTHKAKDIILEGCKASNSNAYKGAAVSFTQDMAETGVSPTDATDPLGLVIRDNWFEQCYAAMIFDSIKGALFEGNTFEDCPNLSMIGGQWVNTGTDNSSPRNIIFKNNYFKRIGNGTNVLGWRVYSSHHITWENNTFEDCGGLTSTGKIFQQQASTASAIIVIDNWWFLNNKFIRSSAQTSAQLIWQTLTTAATVDNTTMRWENNRLYGTFSTNAFPTLNAKVTWAPGSIAAGSSVSTTVSIPGAVLGDGVVVFPPYTLGTGVVASGYVSATDTVTIELANVSTSASATFANNANWKARVIKNDA